MSSFVVGDAHVANTWLHKHHRDLKGSLMNDGPCQQISAHSVSRAVEGMDASFEIVTVVGFKMNLLPD